MPRNYDDYLREAGGAPDPVAEKKQDSGLRIASAEGDRCIHDLFAPACAVCNRNPDAADPGFMEEFGGITQGFGFYDELSMTTKGW